MNMRITNYLLVFALVQFFNQLNAQVVTIDYILNENQKDIAVYDTLNRSQGSYLLRCDFADYKANKTIIDFIISKKRPISQIDLVYTKYAESPKFDQKKLNRKRLEELMKLAPEIFDNDLIQWNLICQTKITKKSDYKNQFHGFVIYLKPLVYPSSDIEMEHEFKTEDEIDFIKSILSSIITDTIVKEKRTFIRDGLFIPILKYKREKGIRYKTKSIWNRKKEDPVYSLTYDTTFIFKSFENSIKDTSVLSVLRRNNKWDSIILVADVTGSMYPYLAQTFMWSRMQMSSANISKFVFFNDGDNNPDGPIGSSYGAYYINSRNIEDVEELAFSTMRKGNGGAIPENDLESLIFAINKCPNCSSIILIADNWAPVRDMSLLREINKPVKIIICGSQNGMINHNYIELAIHTGGSIHTIENDFFDLSKLTDGKILEIGKQKFLIDKGKLILIH